MSENNDHHPPVPASLRLQIWTQGMHVVVIALIVICATVLAASRQLSDQSTTAVFGTALGYAGGAAASRAGGRVSERSSDSGH